MNDIGIIQLTNGEFTIVDADLFQHLNSFTWYRHPQGYAYGNAGGRRCVLMHRFIVGTPKGVKTDHRNRFKLDNTNRNLRTANATESVRNRGANKGNTSGFKGVSWNARSRRWVSQIRFDGKTKLLGYFKTRESAAEAYDKVALKNFREFAVLNGVQGNPNDKCIRLRGEKHRSAKLTEDIVREIRRRLATGESQYSLSKAYGVGRRSMWELAHRKTWAHVQ